MQTNMTRHFLSTFAGLMSLLHFGVLAQTDYPNRPIKIVVPFPAGGTSDVLARIIGV